MALDASNTKVFCRGTDLSTALQSTALELAREEADATAYASAIRTFQPTLQTVQLAHAGLYTDGPFSISEVWRQAKDTDNEPMTICPEGLTLATKAFIVLAEKANLTLPAQVSPGQVHHASIRAKTWQPVGDGVVAFNGTVSANSQTAAYQVGALGVGQLFFATVHLLTITPTPSATFFLESDNAVGFPSPAIQDTSAAQTARGSVLLQEAVPTTDDWWRVRWTFTGTGNFAAVIALGLATR